MSEPSPSNNDPESSTSDASVAVEAEQASDGSADNNGSPTSSTQADAAVDGSRDAAPEDSTPEHSTPEPSAVDDLASGLGLMFRAAKKAVRALDPQKIEAMGREAADRASKEVDKIDREKVNEFGRKAAKSLNPERLEQAAEEAGRELLNVVERVADRMEQALSSKTGARKTSDAATDDAASADATSADADER